MLRVPCPRQTSESLGHLQRGLEQIGLHISFPPCQYDFEGFEPSGILHGACCTANPVLAQPTMVSVPLSEGLCVSGNITTIVPDSERGSLLEFLKTLPVPSYLEFMTRVISCYSPKIQLTS